MKRRIASLAISTRLLFTVLFSIAALGLHGQAKLSIQGFLKKSDGAALPDGEYALKFRIYNVETGGTPIWEETQSTVDVTGGIYSAILGAVTPLNIAFNEPYFVSVTVGSGTEMVPRIPLTSAPYALSLIGQDNIFPSSGNVGIGVIPAQDKLHVKNTVPSNGFAKILLEGPANGVTELNIQKTGYAGTAFLGYNGSDAFRIGHTQGNVDLLTFSPGSTIYMSTPTDGLFRFDGGSVLVENNIVARGGAPGPSGTNRNGYAFHNGGDNDSGLYSLGDNTVSLFTNNTEQLRVEDDAVLAMGGVFAQRGAPDNTSGARSGYSFVNNGIRDHDTGFFSGEPDELRFYTGGTPRMRITMNDIYFEPDNGAGASLAIQADGRVVRVSSSARYKQNIQPLATDFGQILEIEPKSYAYKSTPNKSEIGFIAEELDALDLKHFVVYDGQGRPDAIMYDRMVIYLIPILREQQQRIAALEQEKAQNATHLSALQVENAAMRQLLNELRADVHALKAAANTPVASGSERK